MAITPTYPGVYTERLPAQGAGASAQSSSGLALIGATPMGPVAGLDGEEARVVTSWAEFERTFGTFTTEGRLPLAAWLFFQNGGSRLYVVRCAASDAVKATASITSTVTDELLGFTGDGSDTTFSITLDHKPIVPGSFSCSYLPATTVTSEVVATGDGSTTGYEITLDHYPLTPNIITINWTSGSVSKSQSISVTDVVTGHGNPSGTSIDRTSGGMAIDMTGAVPDNATNVTVTYRYYAAAVSVTEDGEGALAGGATGTINYTTGVVAFTFTNAPALSTQPVGSYTRKHFDLEMLYPGVYGNDYRIAIFGTPGYEDDAHATFTKWTLLLQVENASGGWDTIESFSELELTDTTLSSFMTSVVNDEASGSTYLSVTTGDKGSPIALSGTLYADEVIGGGDGSETEFSATLDGESAHNYSVTITAHRDSDDSIMTITDDGSGHLEGDINANGVNTIDYDTGAITVTFDSAVYDGGDVVVTYYTQAAYDQTTPLVIDFVSGDDGTAITASDCISSELETAKKGVYALDAINEMLMVAIPDFVGTRATDRLLLDWANSRKYRFALLATPNGITYEEAKNYKRQLNRQTVSKGAVYYPWITLKDPGTLLSRTVPPIFHVAGAIAKTDTRRSAAKAPAGVSDGRISEFYAFERNLSKTEVGVLRGAQVNSLVNWPETGGPCVWGANTLEVGGTYGYVHLERMEQYIGLVGERILYTKVYEPHTPNLRAQIVLEMTSFLSSLFTNGWFAGAKASDAFRITCDETNNPPASVAQGILNCKVQYAPTTPAEFIVLQLQQIR